MKIIDLYYSLDKSQKKNIRKYVCSNAGFCESTFYNKLHSRYFKPFELKIFKVAFNKFTNTDEQGKELL